MLSVPDNNSYMRAILSVAGRMYGKLGRFADALKYDEKYLVSYPYDGGALNNAVYCAFQLGLYETALKYAEIYIARYGAGNTEVPRIAAFSAHRLDMYKTAYRYAKMIEREAIYDTELTELLATLSLECGDMTSTGRFLQGMEALEPDIDSYEATSGISAQEVSPA